jgi:hypothetical protein
LAPPPPENGSREGIRGPEIAARAAPREETAGRPAVHARDFAREGIPGRMGPENPRVMKSLSPLNSTALPAARLELYSIQSLLRGFLLQKHLRARMREGAFFRTFFFYIFS